MSRKFKFSSFYSPEIRGSFLLVIISNFDLWGYWVQIKRTVSVYLKAPSGRELSAKLTEGECVKIKQY